MPFLYHYTTPSLIEGKEGDDLNIDEDIKKSKFCQIALLHWTHFYVSLNITIYWSIYDTVSIK